MNIKNFTLVHRTLHVRTLCRCKKLRIFFLRTFFLKLQDQVFAFAKHHDEIWDIVLFYRNLDSNQISETQNSGSKFSGIFAYVKYTKSKNFECIFPWRSATREGSCLMDRIDAIWDCARCIVSHVCVYDDRGLRNLVPAMSLNLDCSALSRSMTLMMSSNIEIMHPYTSSFLSVSFWIIDLIDVFYNSMLRNFIPQLIANSVLSIFISEFLLVMWKLND